MLTIKNEGIVLRPLYDFEIGGVLNPACIEIMGELWMFYRAVNKENKSTIGFCRFKNNELVERFDTPLLVPEYDYEKEGLEDPRITFLNGKYYLFYTAYDGKNARIAYATAEKLPFFKKRGLLLPSISYEKAGELFRSTDLSLRYKAFEERYQESRGKDILLWEKDAFLFPEKIDGKYLLCHRVLPGIQIVSFEHFSDLTEDFWKNQLSHLDQFTILEPKYWYDSWNLGGGCPPIKTKSGWLLIYHTVQQSSLGRVYHASAALLDSANPLKVIGRLENPLFSPSSEYEKSGVVNNVVFPTSAILEGDRVMIYYGAGDKMIAAKSVNLNALLEELSPRS
ncbi:MAG: pesticidal protein Cry7Aa [Candidatus Berkelbacteria bacterium]|nr:pesticidal protein Cry7Aa [Candidatus Berkelbacteria bacterium]